MPLVSPIMGISSGTTWRVVDSVVLKDPSASEKVNLFYSPGTTLIGMVAAVLEGSGGPSVTFILWYGPDKNGTGTAVKVGGFTVTSVTTGMTPVTFFDNPMIPPGNWCWLTTTAQLGTVTQLSVSVVS